MACAQVLGSSESLPAVRLGAVRVGSRVTSLHVARFAAFAALAAMFLAHLGLLTFVDPDLWHEMATARKMWARGAMPLGDCFAYTPTVYPVVHHEWGTGALLYGVASLGGAAA